MVLALVICQLGKFRLDLTTRQLWHDGEVSTLPPKLSECIRYLIEHRDRPVSRGELIEAVWGHAHRSDNTLDQLIRRARQVLGDGSGDRKMIETAWGFGYQWVAPVELIEDPEKVPLAPPSSRPREDTGNDGGRWRISSTPTKVKALLVAVVLIATGITGYFWQGTNTHPEPASILDAEAGTIALLLPVTIEGADETGASHAWARLGLMESITEHLRAAGQMMVSSDTVIALLHDAENVFDAEALKRLTTTTGAGLVLEATASEGVGRWRVLLRSVENSGPSVAVIGEGMDMLEAARVAADAMAADLGLAPSDAEPESVVGMRLLLRQIEAARLAQQMDVARNLIDQADPRLRQHPEIRFQQARLDYYSHDLEAAYAVFRALLDETPADQDSEFRARILNGLFGVYYQRNEPDSAQAMLEEAAVLADENSTALVYSLIWENLGLVALYQSRFDAATQYLARARHGFNSAGDLRGLARLDSNRGVLEVVRDRPARALRYYEGAVTTSAALRDYRNELIIRANMIQAHMALLDLQAAWEIVPRLDELLDPTATPELVASVQLIKAELFESGGRNRAAEDLLNEVVVATQNREDLLFYWLNARALLAERRLCEGDASEAARMAGEVVASSASGPGSRQSTRVERAHLTLVRAYLAQHDPAAAMEAGNRFAEWAKNSHIPSSAIYASLARAELAVFKNDAEAARTAFEHALTLAQAGDAPLRLLQVAERYVPWLLSADSRDPDRALQVAGLVERYSDQHYSAALLELYVYHDMGTPSTSTWRAALARARALAGEREIPAALLISP